LPRASAASTAMEQRSPGHRADYVDISRQAKHTRRPWASSQSSGGAAPVDRCTEWRWVTSDCRQPYPVGEAPSRSSHRGIGQNHMPDEYVEAGVRGRDRGVLGWDGRLACASFDDPPISMGPVLGGWASRVSLRMPTCTGSGSVSIGATRGSRGAFRVSPCMSTCTGSGSVAIGATGGSRGAGPSGGGHPCAGASVLACAGSRGWKSLRRA